MCVCDHLEHQKGAQLVHFAQIGVKREEPVFDVGEQSVAAEDKND